MHGYSYANGNPVTVADPTGLAPSCLEWCGSTADKQLQTQKRQGRSAKPSGPSLSNGSGSTKHWNNCIELCGSQADRTVRERASRSPELVNPPGAPVLQLPEKVQDQRRQASRELRNRDGSVSSDRQRRAAQRMAWLAKLKRKNPALYWTLRSLGTIGGNKWLRRASRAVPALGFGVAAYNHYMNGDQWLTATTKAGVESAFALVGGAVGGRVGALCGEAAPLCIPAGQVLGAVGGGIMGERLTSGELERAGVWKWTDNVSDAVDGWIGDRF